MQLSAFGDVLHRAAEMLSRDKLNLSSRITTSLLSLCQPQQLRPLCRVTAGMLRLKQDLSGEQVISWKTRSCSPGTGHAEARGPPDLHLLMKLLQVSKQRSRLPLYERGALCRDQPCHGVQGVPVEVLNVPPQSTLLGRRRLSMRAVL